MHKKLVHGLDMLQFTAFRLLKDGLLEGKKPLNRRQNTVF